MFDIHSVLELKFIILQNWSHTFNRLGSKFFLLVRDAHIHVYTHTLGSKNITILQ